MKNESKVESLPIADINQCLKTGRKVPFLPLRPWRSKGCVYAGDDERVGDFTFLTIATLLMQRAHNEIARGLAGVNPNWSDEVLYQEARGILIALYQNIIYSEYLELLLGRTTMSQFHLSPLRKGYSYNYNEFVTAGFRLHQTVHTLLTLLDSEFQNTQVNIADFSIPLINITQMASNNWLYYDQINNLLISFLDEATLTSQFSLGIYLQLNPADQDPTRSSMGAFNVQRDRDHGLPSYGYFRQLTGRNGPLQWNDLEKDFLPNTIDILKDFYDYPVDRPDC